MTVDWYWNAFCTGEFVDHNSVFVNDALRFDYLIVQRWVCWAGGFYAELVKIFVVVFHHE